MLGPALGDTLSNMSNVVPFSRPPAAAPQISNVVAVADDLFAALELLQGVAHRAAAMGRPRREMELTVRNLREAVSAVERALDCIGEGDEAGQG
ncbi:MULTISPECIES: hypothetical protein [unclassified Methylobacterium]|uniref:hypothetical protein n=1 Tax=unclassified Methylobacterium TaxID=2615210 RepID=UPI00288A1A90|nr:hypothetical protein [Methylobacterium sp. WCS2018Hpa-22]